MTSYNQTLIDDLRAHGGHATSGSYVGRQVLILTTTGAKTGEPRETPIAYSIDGDRLVIAASKGGDPSNPAWFHNIVAHPTVTLEVDGERFEATASVVDGLERQRLYDAHAALHPSFLDYPTRTERVIPVIVLQRVPASVVA